MGNLQDAFHVSYSCPFLVLLRNRFPCASEDFGCLVLERSSHLIQLHRGLIQ